jgi:hypothetical protein
MPYITPYFTAKEMVEIEVFCEKHSLTKYKVAKDAILEHIRRKKE